MSAFLEIFVQLFVIITKSNACAEEGLTHESNNNHTKVPITMNEA